MKSFFKFLFFSSLFIYILFFSIVLIFIQSPFFRNIIVFLSPISLPLFLQPNLASPELFGFPNGRNVETQTSDGMTLKGWHILPAGETTFRALNYSQNHLKEGTSSGPALPNDAIFDEILAGKSSLKDSKSPVVVYFHGNAFHRAQGHRSIMYHIFTSHLNAHLITFDYRGYGDSGSRNNSYLLPYPTPATVQLDVEAIWRWLTIEKQVEPARILFWGHSLGSAISTNFLRTLFAAHHSEGSNPQRFVPAGLVLEAPFTDLGEAAHYHPLGRVGNAFRGLIPGFLIDVSFQFLGNITQYRNNDNVEEIFSKYLNGNFSHQKFGLMIIHSKNDAIISHLLSEKIAHLIQKLNSFPKTHFFQYLLLPEGGHNKNFYHPEFLLNTKEFFHKVFSFY